MKKIEDGMTTFFVVTVLAMVFATIQVGLTAAVEYCLAGAITITLEFIFTSLGIGYILSVAIMLVDWIKKESKK